MSADRLAAGRLLKAAWWLLLAAAAAVPLAAGFVPFAGPSGVFMSQTLMPAKSTALGVLVGASLALWMLAALAGSVPVRRVPLAGLLGGVAVLAVASSFAALDIRAAVFGGDYAEQGLLAFAAYLGAFFLVVQMMDSKRKLVELARVIALSGGVVALLGVLQSVGLPFWPVDVEAWVAERGMSTMANPDMLGTYLIVPLVLALALAVTDQPRWRPVWLVATAAMGACLLFTQTRGAWLGAAVAVAVFAVGVLRSRARDRSLTRPALGVGAVLVGTAAAVGVYKAVSGSAPLLSRVSQTFAAAGPDSGRFWIWGETLALIARRPLLGFGADNMLYGWYRWADPAYLGTMGPSYGLVEPHDYWLTLAVSFGVPAAIAVLAVVAGVLWSSRGALTGKDVMATAHRGVHSALWAGVVGLCVALSFSVVIAPLALLLWMSMAMLVAPYARAGCEPRVAVRRGVGTLGAVVGVCLVLWGAATGLSSVLENAPGADVASALRGVRAASAIAPWRTSPVLRESRTLAGAGAPASEVSALVDRLLKLAPYEYEYYLVDARLSAGDPARVLRVADAGLAVRPSGIVLMGEKAVALARLGRSAEAEKLAAYAWSTVSAVRRAETGPDAGLSYVRVLAMAGNLDAAVAIMRELTARFPDDPRVAETAAWLQAGLDAAKKAVGPAGP